MHVIQEQKDREEAEANAGKNNQSVNLGQVPRM